MSSSSMQAIRIHDYGGTDQLMLENAPRPEPKAGEVLVRIKAAGVNPADWKFRQGFMKAYVPLNFPWTPGLEGAGVVEAGGEGVAAFKPGDAVFCPPKAPHAEDTVAPPPPVALQTPARSFLEGARGPGGAP